MLVLEQPLPTIVQEHPLRPLTGSSGTLLDPSPVPSAEKSATPQTLVERGFELYRLHR